MTPAQDHSCLGTPASSAPWFPPAPTLQNGVYMIVVWTLFVGGRGGVTDGVTFFFFFSYKELFLALVLDTCSPNKPKVWDFIGKFLTRLL